MTHRIRAGKLIGSSIVAVAVVGFASVTALAASNGSSSSSSMPKGEHIAKGSDCFSCHAVNHKVVGPAFQTIAKKFAGKQGAESTLAHAIQHGEVGTFGKIPMPAHPKISDSQAKEIVSWILSLKSSSSSSSSSSSASKASQKTYSYKINGKTVKTSFPIFKQGSKTKVTKDVFRGYELYNSYCYRCHGEDAVGSEYAPDLRRSLNNGMSEAKFRQIAMTGKKAQGMPSWAGFFTPHQINVIYQYVKARAVGAVGVGTPNE